MTKWEYKRLIIWSKGSADNLKMDREGLRLRTAAATGFMVAINMPLTAERDWEKVPFYELVAWDEGTGLGDLAWRS